MKKEGQGTNRGAANLPECRPILSIPEKTSLVGRTFASRGFLPVQTRGETPSGGGSEGVARGTRASSFCSGSRARRRRESGVARGRAARRHGQLRGHHPAQRGAPEKVSTRPRSTRLDGTLARPTPRFPRASHQPRSARSPSTRPAPIPSSTGDPLRPPPLPLVVAMAHRPTPPLLLVSSGTSTTFPTWRWPPCETPTGAKPTPSPSCTPP